MTWQLTFDLVWLCLLLVFLTKFYGLLRLLRKARHWLQTEGEIVHCDWEQLGDVYWPTLKYSYVVDGQTFHGERIFLDNFDANPRAHYASKVAFQWVSTFKEGKKVSVYYDPGSPALAALSTSIPRKLYLIVALLSALVCVQLVFMLFKVIYS